MNELATAAASTAIGRTATESSVTGSSVVKKTAARDSAADRANPLDSLPRITPVRKRQPGSPENGPVSPLTRIAKKLVIANLKLLKHGLITMVDGDEVYQFGRLLPNEPDLQGTLEIIDPSCYRDILTGGSIGAAEAFMTGDWVTDDLTPLMRVMVRNMDVLNGMESGIARLASPFLKWAHNANRNSEKGSRRNIAAHYDLGNDFFELFLDPTMMYSSGIFPSEDATMEEASVTKLDRICRKLNLKPEDHLVEIGTGWGGMAIHAAKHYGCRVTTTTISRQQYEWAERRIAEEGLQEQITLLLEDYRNLEGQFDKLVSIEMIEAVGWQYYDTYFAKCASLLKPEGLMLIQAITIEDQRYEQARRSVDFIQRYIFPGSCIPSITAMQNSVTRNSDLRLVHLEDITLHYARTLRAWFDAVQENRQKIIELGYSEDFIRMWEFYLCYCEGGFAERVIGDVHLMFAKPLNRTDSILGELGI